MKSISFRDLIQEYSKATGKYCVYISWSQVFRHSEAEEVLKAAPYLSESFVTQHHKGVVICDTEEEMEQCYDMTVGDDGPTNLNGHGTEIRTLENKIEKHRCGFGCQKDGCPCDEWKKQLNHFQQRHARVYALTCNKGEWENENT